MRRHCSGVLLVVAVGCLLPTAGCGEEADDDLAEVAGGGGRATAVRAMSGAGGQSGAGASGEGTGGSEAAGNGGASAAGGAAGGAAGAAACVTLSSEVLAEELPDPEASLAGLTFSGNVASFVDAVLERRHPFGLELVQGGRRETAFGDCSVIFADPAETASDIYAALEVIVHECGHFNDSFLSSAGRDAYVLHSELSFQCERGDTTSRGGDTFARSRIAGDDYQSLRPPCSLSNAPGCDPYADVYLNGDPDDAVFESGDQGFNLLMEEAVQYVNSISTSWAFVDQKPPNISVSSRDGILTFLWYIERYLRMARTEFPEAYTRITTDDCWRDLTLGVWARAQRYLGLTQQVPGLGIEDDEIADLVREPELLEEIERLRELDDCP
jgi:hypothetical protein